MWIKVNVSGDPKGEGVSPGLARPSVGPCRWGQSLPWYLEAGFRPGLPEGSPGRQAVREARSPASSSQSRCSLAVAVRPESSSSVHSKSPRTPCSAVPPPALQHPRPGEAPGQTQSVLSSQPAGAAVPPGTDCAGETAGGRRTGGRGRKLGRRRAGAASCREWGLWGGCPCQPGPRLLGGGGCWQGLLGSTRPPWRPNPAGSRALWLSTNGEHLGWGTSMLPTRASRRLAAGCPTTSGGAVSSTWVPFLPLFGA